MKTTLIATLKNVEHKIEFEKSEIVSLVDDSLKVSIDNRKYEIDLSLPEPNVYLMQVEGRVFEFSVRHLADNGIAVYRRGGQCSNRDFHVVISDPRSLRSNKFVQQQEMQGAIQVRAPMPGKVVRLLINVGSEVSQGQSLIVVEAMKMQNEIKSPKKGHVIEVLVNEGSTVNSNELLIVIE
ncbi:MAG: biotin/lipoyl-containing protein [Pyrinomonadaceae bacterium]